MAVKSGLELRYFEQLGQLGAGSYWLITLIGQIYSEKEIQEDLTVNSLQVLFGHSAILEKLRGDTVQKRTKGAVNRPQ